MFKDWHKKNLKIGDSVYVIVNELNGAQYIDEYIVSDVKKTVLKCKKGEHEIKFNKSKPSIQYMLTCYSLYETRELAQASIDHANRVRALRNYIRDNAVHLTIEERIEVIKIMDKNKKIKELQKRGKIKPVI